MNRRGLVRLAAATLGRLLPALVLAAAGPVPAQETAPAGTALRLQADRTALDLGEPLLLSITAGTGADLDALDTRRLEQDFLLEARSRGQAEGGERLQLVLYPRRAGPLDVSLPPPWTHEPLRLDVGPGGRSAPLVQIALPAGSTRWQVQESGEFTLQACTSGNLIWHKPALPLQEGVSLQWLRESQVELQTPAGRCTATRWSGLLTPTREGPHRIDFGWLSASHFGRLLRWPVPAWELQARAAPLWLPAGVAGSAPAWSLEGPAPVVVAGELAQWRLRIVGNYTADTLRRLLQSQLDAAGWGEEPLGLTAQADTDGNTPHWTVRLYARIDDAQGRQPPPLRLPWVDLDEQRVHHVQVELPPARLLAPAAPQPSAWQRFWTAVAWLTAGAGLVLLAGLLWPPLRRLAWRLRLATSRSPAQLQRVLLSIPGRRGPRPACLADWQAGLPERRDSAALRRWLADFEALRFGAPRGDAQAAWPRLRRALLKLRWLP